MKTTLVILDDHQLFADALTELLGADPDMEVMYAVHSGPDLQSRFQTVRNIPDLVLLDIHMPEMDGFAVAEWLRDHHPDVHVLALSMNEQEADIIRMLKLGVKGYLLKGDPPGELKRAILEVMAHGFYHSSFVSGHLVNMLRQRDGGEELQLSAREKEFLPLACTEMTYREIADQMCVSERTVDGYRESLFRKFDVKSRVGLVLFALRKGLVEL